MIDNRVATILELYEPIDSDRIKKELNLRLKQMQVDDVSIGDVDVDLDGNISVEFFDVEGDIDVIFTLDQEDGPIAFVEPDDEEDDIPFVDLSDLAVPTIDTTFGTYINMLDLSWFNKKVLRMILAALDVEDNDDSEIPFKESDELNELTKMVVRNGKKVRKSLVRRKRKKRLTSAQRQGIIRAKVKRKAKQAQTLRKRKKSMLLRKRSNLKSGNPKGLKVQGTK